MPTQNFLNSILTFMGILVLVNISKGQTNKSSTYNIYAGNTHAHTIFTKSHGEQWEDEPDFYDYHMYVDSSLHVSRVRNTTLRSDWHKYQGLPSRHFALAKVNGYDFYTTTDHSQETGFFPTSPISSSWITTKQQAIKATDSSFVALTGYEHSENNGPGGRGHINVINTSTYLNALEPGIDLPYLYKWLKTVKPNGNGPVVASFNHPEPHGYNNWAHRDSKVMNIITMLEVINTNYKIYYKGFVNALDKGWKVSPICGHDNHGLKGILHDSSRTYVLATNKTKTAILNAMKHRRTYASLEQNIQARYKVNGKIMGSTFDGVKVFKFDIDISDPDTNNPRDKITKIDIVKDYGVIEQTYIPSTPSYSVRWNPIIHDTTSTYFFVRVWNAGGGDAPRADPTKPVGWLAPIWTGR